MMWNRNTLLGLKLDKSKSNQSLSADWIFKMPHELIIPFLQSMADEDGYATVRSTTAGIGSKHNKEFLRKLLDIFGIHSVDGGTGIIITRKKSLKIAANLPLFKYADGRLFRLREIIEMITSIKYSKVSEEERKRILEYYRQGIKVNQIGSLLWVDFGKNRRSSTVKKVINDANA